MPFKIKGDKELIRQLRQAQDEVLPDLAPVVDEAATEALARALPYVPVRTGGLLASATKVPVQVHPEQHFAAAKAGFTHPAAAYVHEGWHWGVKQGTPPRFLKKGALKARTRMRKALLSTLQATLARIFKDKER